MPKPVKPLFVLGTSVRITTVLDIASPDSVKITIKSPNYTILINEIAMTKEADKIYTYVYQSKKDDLNGDYVATISVVSGSYEAVAQDIFSMIDQLYYTKSG